MKRGIKIFFTLIFLIIVALLIFKFTSQSNDLIIDKNILLLNGSFEVYQALNDNEFNVIDVTNCAISNISSPLINGLWLGPWDGEIRRTLVPDTNAVYAEIFLPVLPKEEYGQSYFSLNGEFPESRFMSYHLYNEKFVLEGDSHVKDVEIISDNGSLNPFISGYPIKKGDSKNYTLKIIDYNKSSYFKSDNILEGGYIASGDKVLRHSLMVRYYDPKRLEGKLPGLVEFPRVLFNYKNSDNLTNEIKTNPCLLFNLSWYGDISKALEGDSSALGRRDKIIKLTGNVKYPGYMPENNSNYTNPEWIFGANMVCVLPYLFPEGIIKEVLDKFAVKFAGETPQDFLDADKCGVEYGRGAFNFDNRYLFSFLDPTRGSAVMKMKNLEAARYGQSMINGNEDVRYWSVCMVQAENKLYTYSCARDDQLVVDSDGYVTFVFTKFEDKPNWVCDITNVSGEVNEVGCKYNWFPYVSPVSWFYLRTLVGNNNSEAYENLPITFEMENDPNDFNALKKHMGEYYPEGRYCSFENESCLNAIKELGNLEN